MEILTFETVKKMRSVGFSYPDYDHFLNKGMVYYYLGDEYIIGGYFQKAFSEDDKLIAEKAYWLPDESHLLSWLRFNSFSYTIRWDDGQCCYYIEAYDNVCGARYVSEGIDLANSLAKIIIRICKSKLRDYTPSPVPRLEITE